MLGQLLRATLPRLADHFAREGFPLDVLSEWYMTAFSFPGFPTQTGLRAWDSLLAAGPKALFRVALAVLAGLALRLQAAPFEDMYAMLKQPQDRAHLEPEQLLRRAGQIELTNRQVAAMIVRALGGGVLSK